jgi:predicted nucleotide-binding protein (sugar kinase/HSP70/actin superfamily)
MGAYGAALYAQSKVKDKDVKSTILGKKELENFVHEIKVANCGLCSNNCRLTINTFADGRKFIGGNRCERPITKKKPDESMNIYEYKLKVLGEYKPVKGNRGKIGIPMGLNMFELLPFWHRFFTELGFEVVCSPLSSRKLYQKGQQTIPSDTVCFPAKLMHGHIKALLDMGIDTIFYPCMSYNLDENLGDNHYNCPVVAYYPEVIYNNMKEVRNITFIKDYLGIHRKKDFTKKAFEVFSKYFNDLTQKEVKNAVNLAYEEYDNYFAKIRSRGNEIIAQAEKEGKGIIVLSGRPYHVDPEINHGISKMIGSFDVAVISEDCVSDRIEKFKVGVLNQWTYHSRLYAAAKYVSTREDMNLVQLVSFGCGVDAITTDEVRDILEKNGKIYTQVKIDEITNLGAVKIRIRSLLAAIGKE